MEIEQDKITSHVQESCKGSFDCSYLASLEEWLDMVVLAWLKEALMRGISRKKLLEHLYNTPTPSPRSGLRSCLTSLLSCQTPIPASTEGFERLLGAD